MTGPELTEEEIMDNDKDPMEALREIRREEGAAEEDLPGSAEDDASSDQDQDDNTQDQEGDDEEEDQAPEASDGASDGDEGSKSVEGEDQDQEAAKKTGDADDEDGDDDDGTGDDKGEEGNAPLSRKFKADGKDYEFTNEEMLDQFETVFGQAVNYTQKMQKIAPYRKMISALEQEGVTHDSLNLALDALKGDKGAIKKLIENNKLDAYDITNDDEEATPYTPNVYGKDETVLDIEEITGKISGDEEFKITTNVIDEQWDNESRQAFVKDPKMIIGLHNDIKSGVYDKVAPAAMKLKVLDENSKSDIEYYMIAGQQLQAKITAETKTQEGQAEVDKLNTDAQSADSKFDKATSEAKKKRAASSTGARADRKGVIDYLDDDDEAYDEWYKNLNSSI